MQPLSDVTVVDATQVVSGPFASTMLADLGAEVVKVERPDGGDIGRTNAPFVGGVSTYFAAVNRNKRSVALDLRSEAGREAFLSLAEKADVVVENHPPGRMGRFGLDYESVRARNPDVVYCSITGFGQTGPYRELPALDIVVQAMSGIMDITGPPDGRPYRAGIPVADIASSMYAVQAILAALYGRDRARTGADGSAGDGESGGEYIDVSMLDCTLSWLTVRAGYTFGTGEPYPRMGNELSEYVPYGLVEAADGPMAVVAATDAQWRALCAAIDRPELATDERFETVDDRREHRGALDAALDEAFAERPSAEWFDRLAEAGVPAAPVYDTLEVWDDPQVQSRGLRDSVDADGETLPTVGYPVRFEGFEPATTERPPELGEHTREALAEAGYSDSEIDDFVAAIEAYAPDSA